MNDLTGENIGRRTRRGIKAVADRVGADRITGRNRRRLCARRPPPPATAVPLSSISDVASVEELADGGLRVTLANGRVVAVAVAADQVTRTAEGILISEAALAEIEAAAGLTAATGGFPLAAVAGAVALGAGGLAIAAGGGDDDGGTPAAPANRAPAFTSVAAAAMSENTTATGLSVAASDPDGDAVTYSISGGADAARLVINGSTGTLGFVAAPDFEAPADAGANNVNDVAVTVTDGRGGSATQTIAAQLSDRAGLAPLVWDARLGAFADAHNAAMLAADEQAHPVARRGRPCRPHHRARLSAERRAGDAHPRRFRSREPCRGGAHRIEVESCTQAGLIESDSLEFSVDTLAPALTGFGLVASSDLGTAGDSITTARQVSVTGTAEAGRTVTIGGESVIVAATGRFVLSGITLQPGANTITAQVADLAGNVAAQSISVTYDTSGPLDTPVLDWIAVTLQAVRLASLPPTVVSRLLAIQSVAVLDANRRDQRYAGLHLDAGGLRRRVRLRRSRSGKPRRHRRDGTRSHRLCRYDAGRCTWPPRQRSRGGARSRGRHRGSGRRDHRTRRRRLCRLRRRYRRGGRRPVGADRAVLRARRGTKLATMDPWAIPATDALRPDGPPALTSADYANALNEVQSLDRVDSKTRTADQTEIARFWLGAGSTVTPGGMWTRIGLEQARARRQRDRGRPAVLDPGRCAC